MTMLDKLANILSGGELGALRHDEETLRAMNEQWRTLARLSMDNGAALRSYLAQIAALETPHANATVRKMARIAREALE